VEAAVTVETAKSLHIKVGSVIHVPGVERAPLAVRVTGIVVPRDPEGAYWAAQPLLRTPDLVLLPGNGAAPDKSWAGSLPLPPVAAAAFGAGTVAAVVLVMAGGLAADRRRAEFTLLRARGASLPGLAGRLLAETAVVALPAGAAGLALTLLALPGGRSSYAIAA